MKKIFFAIFIIGFIVIYAQQKPKLVVGIVVDQMRYDYIARFYADFEADGFKRLVDKGFLYRNAHYDFMPTKTGPGHASIYTGCPPARHGIIGNDWYNPLLDKRVNCVFDSTVFAVGGTSKKQVSPQKLQSTTITDELRLFYNFESKVVGISLKDRGAVLPAGHHPSGAYWYDSQSGKISTSTYYMKKLPKWVVDYNKQKRPSTFLSGKWDLLKDISIYNESIADENSYEKEFKKGLGVSFPYRLSAFKKDFSLLAYTPFTNTMIKEVSMKAVIAEKMGMDDIPDFLTISFSATDAVGHLFGPRSIEVQDTYLRLDQEISELLSFLDNTIGENEYMVFLTADHGVSDIPSYMHKNKMIGGYHNNSYIKSHLNSELSAVFGEGTWINSIINEQIYLNKLLISEKNIVLKEVKKIAIDFLLKEEYITEVFDSDIVAMRMFTDPMLLRLQNGYHKQRSGDILYILSSNNLNDAWGRQGTTHLSPYTYDTHVPIIFYGVGIKKGTSVRPVAITDIAPTLSMLLNISLPSTATGKPLKELFE